MITRRRFVQASLAAATAGLGVGGYAWQIEPHWLEIVARDMPIEHLPSALDGARLVQLSDMHVGPQVPDNYILESFDRVRELTPEFVVYSGDFTSYAADVFDHAARVYRNLPRGTLGTFGILGNHDYGPGWQQPEVAARLADQLNRSGVRMLRNEVAEAAGLQVAGLDDLWAGRFDPERGLAALDSSRASIVLSHNPDTVDIEGWDVFRGWILAGHTHGGQCKPPFLPPPLLPVRNRRYTAGEFALDGGRRMYISRGLGHLLQVRFNVRPEVTVFTLRR